MTKYQRSILAQPPISLFSPPACSISLIFPFIKRIAMPSTSADNSSRFQAMEIGTLSTTDDKDQPMWRRVGIFSSRHWPSLMWGSFVILAVVVYCTKNGKETVVLEEEKHILESSNKGQGQQSHDDFIGKNLISTGTEIAASRYHNTSFPGMDDNTTHLESCPARIIVELERHYSQNVSMPFSLLLFDNSNSSMCGTMIESVENYPGSCGLPPDMQEDGPGDLTIPEWVEYCIPDDDDPMSYNNTGFMFYYDWCPAYLLWDTRSCPEWIATKADNPQDIKIVENNISLLDGAFTGTVVASPSMWSNKPNKNQTAIFVPDVFNSCWQVDCGWSFTVSTDECVQFSQENLVRVSLEDYVNTTKKVMCE